MNAFSAASAALEHAANRSRFFFRAQGVPDATFAVKSFSGRDHGLSQDYAFELELSADTFIAPELAIGKKGVLELLWQGQTLPIHGVIGQLSCAGTGNRGHDYTLTLASPLHPLKLSRGNRVFVGTTTPQVIEEVLAEAGIVASEYALELQGDYPLREFVVQYDESDYDFLARLCAHDGVFFRFAQSQAGARVLFHDGVDELPAAVCGELLYEVHSGTRRARETVFALRPRARLLSERVELKDYNDQTPEARLVAFASSAAGGGAGRDYRYGEHFRDLDQGQHLARIRQQLLDWQRESFVAESDCAALAPGAVLTLIGHPEEERNGDYLILEVEHHGDQRAGHGETGRGMTYRNRLLLIRAGSAYRPPLPEKKAMHGLFTARIETAGGDYAYLDEQGRYRLRTDFDLGAASPGAASHPVRMAQPYAGREYGFHFPLHAGTEVVISCVNGDLDRPVILGALPNPETPSPVTSANPSQNVLRTWGGNELVMDDRKNREKTELFTRDRRNVLTLDAERDGHRVRLASEEGEMEVYAAKTLLLESGDTHSVQSGNDHLVTVENAQRLMTRNGTIEQQAATDIRMKAGDHILLQAEKQDVEIGAGRDLVVEVGRSLSVEVRSDDLEMLVAQGRLDIRVAQAITIAGRGGGVIHIGQGGGSIEISVEGDVTIAAPTVDINAATINLKGSAIGNN